MGNLEPRGLGVLGGGVQGSPTVLILILVLLFAWVGAVLWSCFLTSAARRVGEVRKCSAERAGRQPARPAAVAAVSGAAHFPYGWPGCWVPCRVCVVVVRGLGLGGRHGRTGRL